MVALPGEHDFLARQSHPFARTIVYQNMDLTGYTAYMPVRQKSRGGKMLFQLTTDVGGGIIIDGPTGTIDLYASSVFMRSQPNDVSYYDLVLLPDGNPENEFAFLTGRFIISDRVDPEQEQ